MLYEIRMKDLRNEALAEGMAQGIAKGMAEGMAQGKAQGMAQGKAEAEIQVAKNLLHMGLGTAQIATATGLPAAEVERLQAELEAAKA